MANQVYESIYGGGHQQISPQVQQSQRPPMTIQELSNMLHTNPALAIRQSGFSVPDEIAGNAQAVVSYLIQTGQVNIPALQKAQMMRQRFGF